jgi:hypothetical protein
MSFLTLSLPKQSATFFQLVGHKIRSTRVDCGRNDNPEAAQQRLMLPIEGYGILAARRFCR